MYRTLEIATAIEWSSRAITCRRTQETNEPLPEILKVDELYPGYDPALDPNPVTCWGMPTAEELEASAKAATRRNTVL